jgi:hypothetical protein
MRQSFWKATGISLACYGTVIAGAFAISFPAAIFLLAVLQVTWTLFCVFRVVQLTVQRRQGPATAAFEPDDFQFALGGLISSILLLAGIVASTQIV